MSPKYHYRIFDFSMGSDIFLPQLVSCVPDSKPIFTIQIGKTPKIPNNCFSINKVRAQLGHDHFLLKVPNVAIFYVKNGNSILVEKFPASDEKLISVLLLEIILAALLYQGGNFLLNGTAVEKNGKAIIFCGPPGTGKSTIAASLIRDGYKLLSDDICLVKLETTGSLKVYSFCPYLKLWKDILNAIDLSALDMEIQQLRPDIYKYGVKLSSKKHFTSEATQIKKIYCIQNTVPDNFKINKLDNTTGLKFINNSRYCFPFFKDVIKNSYHPIKDYTATNELDFSLIDRYEEGDLTTNIGILIENLTQDLETL